MMKGMIDSYELWQSRPENLNENMEDPIKSAENRGWNQCNRSWIKTIEEQPRVGEWIPCSERLPDNTEHDWVLAQVQEDNGFMWIPNVMEYRQSKDDWYLEGTGWLKDVYSEAFKVIAWMPLPPAFEGE